MTLIPQNPHLHDIDTDTLHTVPHPHTVILAGARQKEAVRGEA